MVDLKGVDTPAAEREPAMQLCSVKMRQPRLEELHELALLFGCSRSDVIRYCVSVGVPELRRMLEDCEPADLSTGATQNHPPAWCGGRPGAAVC